MTRNWSARVGGLCLPYAAAALLLHPGLSLAQSQAASILPLSAAGTSGISGPSLSSSSSADSLVEEPLPQRSRKNLDVPAPGERETRPLHSLAVGLTLGSGGVGIQLATPLTAKINLRVNASLFSYTTSFIVDTIPIAGTLRLRSASASLDYAPTGRNFHISPGLTFYDQTRYNALIFVPGGQVIQFDDQPYTSDPNDPIRGTALINFGGTAAPRLTVGYGNVIRHHTAGFTFPVDVGFEYIRTPTAVFNLTGSSCDSSGDCGPIKNDPSTQANIQEQQNEINSEIHPLRIFPIVSVGISYKFGH